VCAPSCRVRPGRTSYSGRALCSGFCDTVVTERFIDAFTNPVSGQGDLTCLASGPNATSIPRAAPRPNTLDTSLNPIHAKHGPPTWTLLSIGRDSWSFHGRPGDVIYYSATAGRTTSNGTALFIGGLHGQPGLPSASPVSVRLTPARDCAGRQRPTVHHVPHTRVRAGAYNARFSSQLWTNRQRTDRDVSSSSLPNPRRRDDATPVVAPSSRTSRSMYHQPRQRWRPPSLVCA